MKEKKEETSKEEPKVVFITARLGVYVDKEDGADVAKEWLEEQLEEMDEIAEYSVTEDEVQDKDKA